VVFASEKKLKLKGAREGFFFQVKFGANLNPNQC
jgi:hypothetical protein